MTIVKVVLVKYDMDKTTNRKRKDLLVDERSERAVIKKLEKIHKGEKVKDIHEIVWGEETSTKKSNAQIHTGVIKFFNEEDNFGFIVTDVDKTDLFFHGSSLAGAKLYAEDPVEFEIGESPKGPAAVRIKLIIG